MHLKKKKKHTNIRKLKQIRDLFSLILVFVHSLTHSFIHSFIYIACQKYWRFMTYTRLLVPQQILSFLRSFVHSFVYSFIYNEFMISILTFWFVSLNEFLCDFCLFFLLFDREFFSFCS